MQPPTSPALRPALSLASILGDEATRQVCISVAQSAEDRDRASAFLASEGFSATGIPPRGLTLIATSGERVVAVAACSQQDQMVATPRVITLRLQGRLVAFCDPLVLAHDLPADLAGMLLRALLRLSFLALRRIMAATDLVLCCHEPYARWFRQALLFDELDGDPARDGMRVLRLDLDLAPGRWHQWYGDGPWSPYALYARPSVDAQRLISYLRAVWRPTAAGATPSRSTTTWISRIRTPVPQAHDGDAA
jgi:hypothetical protein